MRISKSRLFRRKPSVSSMDKKGSVLNFRLSKRKKYVITSLVLSFGFTLIVLIGDQYRFWGIGGLSVLTLILFFWSLKEGLYFDLTLIALILPTFFTIGVGLFWFLLPSHILARIPIIITFGIGIYSLCLTMNIYTVGVVKAIQLIRAARGFGFVLTLFTLFLLFDAILSLRTPLYFTAPAFFLVSFPIFLQGYWSTTLDKKLNSRLILITAISALIVSELVASLYFIPVTVVVGSLYLTFASYILLGLGQANLEGRLFKQTVREYVVLGILVVIGMVLIYTVKSIIFELY